MNGGERMVIIDGAGVTRASLCDVFGRAGYQIETAATVWEAVRRVRARSLDVALVDVALPGADPVRLLVPVKEIHPDMAVSMVTGYAAVEKALQTGEARLTAYVTKPLSLDEVLAMVGQAVAGQRARLRRGKARHRYEAIPGEGYRSKCDGSKDSGENGVADSGAGFSEESRRYAEGIVCAVREPLLVLDEKLRVVSASEAFYRAFNFTQQETEGRWLGEVGGGQWDIPELHCRLGDILPHNTAFDDLEVERDFPKAGQRTLLLSGRRERRAGETRMMLLAIEDITERKRAEEKVRAFERRLRSLASQLTLAEERERKRLATGLHDQVGQPLAVMKMKLSTLGEQPSTAGLGPQIEEIQALVDEVIQQMRSLTFELSPPVLYELGLEAALEWLAEQLQQKHGIMCTFEDDGQAKPMGEDARGLLFWIVRELLMNVVKHARARCARVSIWRNSDSVSVMVADDGIGFDVSEMERKTRGFGLFSIRERLSEFGGSVEIKSRPGRGTQVTLTAPLECDGEEGRDGH